MKIKIAPSLLAADMSCLADEIARAVDGGCDAFHVDIQKWIFEKHRIRQGHSLIALGGRFHRRIAPQPPQEVAIGVAKVRLPPLAPGAAVAVAVTGSPRAGIIRVLGPDKDKLGRRATLAGRR